MSLGNCMIYRRQPGGMRAESWIDCLVHGRAVQPSPMPTSPLLLYKKRAVPTFYFQTNTKKDSSPNQTFVFQITNEEMANPGNVVGGLKANLSNPSMFHLKILRCLSRLTGCRHLGGVEATFARGPRQRI